MLLGAVVLALDSCASKKIRISQAVSEELGYKHCNTRLYFSMTVIIVFNKLVVGI